MASRPSSMFAAKPAFLASSFLRPLGLLLFLRRGLAVFSSAIVSSFCFVAIVDSCAPISPLETEHPTRSAVLGRHACRPHLGSAKGAHTCPNVDPSQSARRSSCRTASSSSPSARMPTRVGLSHLAQTSCDVRERDGARLLDDAALGVAASGLRMCRLTMRRPSDRHAARPRGRSRGSCRACCRRLLPSARRPTMTWTVSPTFSFCMVPLPARGRLT